MTHQTFCAKCLQRSLDHNNQCPLCRQDLTGFAYFQDHPYNQTIYSISCVPRLSDPFSRFAQLD